MNYKNVDRITAIQCLRNPVYAGGTPVFIRKNALHHWAELIHGIGDASNPLFDDYEFAVESLADNGIPAVTYPIEICHGYVIFDTVSDPSEPRYPRFDKPLRAAVLMNEICSIKEGAEYLLGDATVKLVVITTRRGEIFLIRNDGNHSIDSYVKLIASP